MGFSRQEQWSGLPFPPPGDLPDPRIEPGSPALQLILYHLSHQGSPECLMRWLQIKKHCRFQVSSFLILCNYNEPFLDWIVTLDEKRILYNNWLDWGEPPEHSQSHHFPKPKKSQGHCLVVCWLIHYSSLNPSEPSHLRSVLSKSMRGTDHSAPAASPAQQEGPDFPTTTPDCTSHNQHAESWTDWATEVCLTHHIHLTSCQPTTTSSSISTTCAGKTLPKPAGYYAQGINKLISHWQKCVDCNGSYFD